MTSRGIEKAISVCAALLLCLGIFLHFKVAHIGDKEGLLFLARQMLHGRKLYVDLIEVNPPLILWIYCLPVMLSEHFSLFQDYHFLTLLSLCVLALATMVSLEIIRHHPAFAADAKRRVQFCLLLGCVLVPFTNPTYFADREYLFLVLVLPYMFLGLPGISDVSLSRVIRIAAGIMAGIGFCIKPYCAIVFFWILLVRIVQKRSFSVLWSLENTVICCIATVYCLAVWFITPEYIRLIVPMALATYSAYNHFIGGVLYFVITAFILGVTFADFRLRYTSSYRKDIFYLLALCPGLLAYALLNNGWGYTWNPLISMTIIISGFVLWEYMYLKETHEREGLPYKQFLFGIRACLLNLFTWAFFFITALHYGVMATCGNYLECPGGQKFLTEVALANGGKPLRSMGCITVNGCMITYMSRQSDIAWGMRFSQLWMLPAFFGSDDAFVHRNEWILNYVDHAYAEDLARQKPELILVESDETLFYKLHKHVDLLKLLLMRPEFRNEWRHYQFARDADCLVINATKEKHPCYYLYRRVD